MTAKGMNFFYNSDFLNRLSQKEVNFITLHEDFHLLWNHPKRTITGQYDHKLANIAQDMIINHIIWEDIPHRYVEIPKDADGKNMALFVPKEYTGKLIFEEIYEWLRDEKEKRDKQKKQNQCQSCQGTGQKQDPNNQKGDDQNDGQDGDNPCDDCNGSGQKDGGQGGSQYGPFGKNPRDQNSPLDTWSLDQILDNLDTNQGQYLDQHLGDEISEEMRESMVKDAMERLQARGLSGGNVEQTLSKLRKQRKDYLKYIKRTLSNVMFGTTKTRTITRPNRRGISGVKVNKKIKNKINCILDTSGSMGGQGTFERVLSYINRSDIEVNLIESDTEIKWVQNIKSKKQLESVCIKGLGGTIMQSGFNYVVENFNEYNTVLLTDGYTDSLDLSKVKGNVLIISVGVECPISKSNGRLKQIVLDSSD
jgi:predicted metal-dependent peptidase